MYITFNKLSPGARTWVYQANRKMTDHEKRVIEQKLRGFSDEWMVHGAPLEASFAIRHDLFIILSANDTTSGCSIDSSVRAVKEIGDLTGIDFFNRNLIAFRNDQEIKLIDLALLKSEFQKGTWNKDTFVFNNLVSTMDELEKQWLVPAGTTWLKRYIARPESVQ